MGRPLRAPAVSRGRRSAPAGATGPAGKDGTDGKDGSPPAGWTYTDALGVSYTCQRAADFDPDAFDHEALVPGAVPERVERVELLDHALEQAPLAFPLPISSGGREYRTYYDGKNLQRLAFEKDGTTYWISNTLNLKLNDAEMLALAANLTTKRS